ncbi:GntR family transcriptional regulator [Isoptericola sp. 4D.3]|uniref:GntR family transcriptional regulator n=1 Tax=Isoptericola peretonis TaxID=2918523 RepID=A0ABT0IZZ3_9MICO|nr:GntR family transcriptional regulator [Isoptericola sp. 4D.3]
MAAMSTRTASLPSGGTAPTLARKILRDDVYDALLEMLMTQRLAPGQSLSIDGLARELGVSQTPIREALVQLEHTGLVIRAALKGYTVTAPLTAAQMAELIDAREVIELAAVERAVGRSGLSERLESAHAEHQAVIARYGLDRQPSADAVQGQLLEYFRADWAFHETIIRGCGNRFIDQMASILGANVHRMRQSMDRGLTDSADALREHAEILAAFQVGNRARAVGAMARHLQGVSQRAQAEAPPGH